MAKQLNFVAYATAVEGGPIWAWTTQGPERPHLVRSQMEATVESPTAAVRADMARLLRLWADRLEANPEPGVVDLTREG